MKNIVKLIATCTIVVGISSCSNESDIQKAANNVTEKTICDSLSFGYGYSYGKNFVQQIENNPTLKDSSFNKDMMIKGFVAALYKDTTVDEDEVKRICENYFRVMHEKAENKRAAEYAATADKYNKNGYQSIEVQKGGPSISKKVITEGKGENLKSSDLVLADLEIKSATDGKVIASTAGQQPTLLSADPQDNIPGLAIALQNMKDGEKASVLIPSALGFGEKGMGQVAPNTDLDITVDVKKVFHSKKEAQDYLKQNTQAK